MDNSLIFDSGLDFLSKQPWFLYFNIHGYPILGMVWNFLLLLIPYYSVKILTDIHDKDGFKSTASRAFSVVLSLVWIVFIPNSAYIITDVRHLADPCSADSFYKVCPETAWAIPVFFLYALSGFVAFYFLLRQMQGFLERLIGDKGSQRLILSFIPIISLGVMLGLLNRLNSWEVVTRPVLVLKTAFLYITDMAYFIDWISFALLLIILYIIGGKIFKHS